MSGSVACSLARVDSGFISKGCAGSELIVAGDRTYGKDKLPKIRVGDFLTASEPRSIQSKAILSEVSAFGGFFRASESVLRKTLGDLGIIYYF